MTQTFPDSYLNRYHQVSSFMRKLRQQTHGYCYMLVVNDGDQVLNLYPRLWGPCYGDMRPYGKDVDQVHRPPDLYYTFPKEGHVIAVALPLHRHRQVLEYALSGTYSPWRELMSKSRLFDYEDGYTGMLLQDTRVNADLLGNFLKMTKSGADWSQPQAKDPVEAFAEAVERAFKSPYGWGQAASDKVVSVERLFTGRPDVPKNFDLYDGHAYRRPVIETIWSDSGKSVDLTKKNILSEVKRLV